jgi:hypothetical protein
LGILGDTEEPLLNLAIADITGIAAKISDTKKLQYEIIGDTDMDSNVINNMFVDNIKVRKKLRN